MIYNLIRKNLPFMLVIILLTASIGLNIYILTSSVQEKQQRETEEAWRLYWQARETDSYFRAMEKTLGTILQTYYSPSSRVSSMYHLGKLSKWSPAVQNLISENSNSVSETGVVETWLPIEHIQSSFDLFGSHDGPLTDEEQAHVKKVKEIFHNLSNITAKYPFGKYERNYKRFIESKEYKAVTEELINQLDSYFEEQFFRP